MYDLSWHTHQINLWIALSGFEPTFSATLGEIGYECDVIEEQLYLHDEDGNETIHPDIVLTNASDDHSLVVDCKSADVEADQLRRYLALDGNEEQLILQGLVQDVAPNDLVVDETLSSFADLTDSEVPTDFAVVHFDHDATSGLAIWNPDSHRFANDTTREHFPINVDPSTPLPTGHYPYDIYEADKESMVADVLTTVVSLAMTEGEYSIDDILTQSHPYWDKLGSGKRDDLRARVEVIHLELIEAGLDEYLERIAGTQGSEWRRTSRTIQAIHDRTEFYVERVLEELPQARLDHDAWASDNDDGEGENN
jgi:hypothetical protein